MEFALTMEVSEPIIKNGVSDYIKQLSDQVAEFFKKKDYGDDLQTLYIGIICVTSEFDFFFKVRKPKYKKGKKVTIEDGRPYERTDSLVYDIKLDYDSFVNANENEVKMMLSTELLKSFIVFDSVKIKRFDRESFEKDVTFFLESYIK
ncbi:hypothetical protein [Pedobacter nutrimenti]|uniref:Immunity protein 44 of polymorphic toxin system n=1 Tax=Pedobacter nutrimenti TaxID=1241337 RepID=A0A318UE97_9SPHI|nr:hypothetical protein [Pedobacter nutrimenti]PYF72979.1 hypothetical protein B0O44_105354 [Pedobacter nutrimenti]